MDHMMSPGSLSEVDARGVGRRLLEDLEARVAEAETSRGASPAEVEAAQTSFRNLTRNINPTDAALRLLDEAKANLVLN